ncbi:MAG: S-adenosylmethionine:tRNA ribosyltransferase-isomerase [Bacteroidaceae bacterium]|nr:S-adenosylmethionine:tRNA ribosyltransferase-isomerase [Bacteroidaceae bacterium]
MDTKEIQIKDFNYPLPDERIAKFPLPERDSSKLLVYKSGEVSDDVFRSLPRYLPQGALMVFNNTKVIRARLHFRKNNPSVNAQSPIQGALIEIFLLEPAFPVEYQENFITTSDCSWYCLVGNSKKWKEGQLYGQFQIGGTSYTISAERVAPHGTSFEVHFRWQGNFAFSEVLEALGELPIPPYLNRKTEESDLRTYQTVYSKIKGSVAAPTAGLHFTERVLADLDKHGIEREELTLHVGAGTFKPVKSEEIGAHEMHTEHIAVRLQTIEKLIAHEGKAIAVGTTSVRTLESLYYMGIKAQQLMDAGKDTGDAEELHVEQWMPYEQSSMDNGQWTMDNARCSTVEALKSLRDYLCRHKLDVLHSSTQIIIAPGYKFHIVQMMVTNFHQPQSTLLLLVSAFVHGDWHKIYDYALAHDFRFLSYGDSSLLIP